MIRSSDLALAYGGEALMRKYAGLASMLPQGPGRSKILLTADVDWREHLDVIASSVSDMAGRACTNTTDPSPSATACSAALATAAAPPSHQRASPNDMRSSSTWPTS